MSKTAKPNPLMQALEAIGKLGSFDKAVVTAIVAGQGEISTILAKVGNLADGERRVLLSLLRERYKDDGSLRQRPGRRPRKAQQENGGGDV